VVGGINHKIIRLGLNNIGTVTEQSQRPSLILIPGV